MKIITLQAPPPPPPTVVTVGNFDGAHSGHIRLIARAVSLAKASGAASVAVTFEPHTRSVVYPELSTVLLTTFEEKVYLLKKLGVDYVFRADFDESFRRLTQEEFVKNILVDKLNASDWVMGEGHHVGQNLPGVKKSLHFVCGKYHINMFTEPLEVSDGAVISSTRIRALVSEGRVAEANRLLGHPYLIAARRVHGVKVGRTLGYPTLNFKCEAEGKVLPPPGVYAAELETGMDRIDGIDGAGNTNGVNGSAGAAEIKQEKGEGLRLRLQGALYFGNCPTYAGRDTHFEFHALRFEDGAAEPAIGETARIWLRGFIRPDIAFANSRALADQIALDINGINKIFSNEEGAAGKWH